MRSIGVALALVHLASSPAYADGPIAARAGLGITADRDDNSGFKLGPGFHCDLGYRVHSQIAVGVHVGITRNSETVAYENFHVVYMSLQIGVGAHWSLDRFWVAPWIGVDDRGHRYDGDRQGDEGRHLGFGLAAGADLYISPSDHRIGPYLDVTRGQADEDEPAGHPNHLYVSAGIAYRYW